MNIRKLKNILPYGFVKWYQSSRTSMDTYNELESKYQLYINNNRELQCRHLNERCFIIGTGPSINNQDLSMLKNETCIGLNMFYLSSQYDLVKPKYNLFSGIALHPKIHDIFFDVFDEMRVNIHDDASVLLNVLDIEYLNRYGSDIGKEKYFFDFCRSWSDEGNYNFDAVKPLYGAQNVALMALQVAVYMGFKEIYLVGCDHDWILRFESKPSTHCYEKINSTIEKRGITDWSETDWGFWLGVYKNIWDQYKKIDDISSRAGVSIFNATDGGILDVFERKSLNHVLTKER